MQNQGSPLQDLNDISTIEAGTGPFEIAQELSLLTGKTPAAQPIPVLALPDPDSNQTDRPVTATKSGLLQAETCWNSKGTFMADLARFMREISFESREYDIYEPEISSEEGAVQNHKGKGQVSQEKQTLKVLLSRKVGHYVMDFEAKKLNRVKSAHKFEKPTQQFKPIQQNKLQRASSAGRRSESSERSKPQKKHTLKPHPKRKPLYSPRHAMTKQSLHTPVTKSQKTILSVQGHQSGACAKPKSRLMTTPTQAKGSRLRQIFK